MIKGNPSRNDWEQYLKPNRIGTWRTGKPPRDWSAGDRLFCWESTPRLRIIGLAEIVNTDSGKDDDGLMLFKVRYLSRLLKNPITIDELRKIPIVNEASFLKSGPATTVFPISDQQAEIIFSLLSERNPEIKSIWPDSVQANVQVPDVDEEFFSGVEGGKKVATHIRKERNARLVKAKKQKVLKETGKLVCEACGFDFEATYNGIGKGFCEVHHKKPLSEVEREVETSLEDLAILCSNCHRMIHKTNPLASIETFRTRFLKLKL